MNLPEELLTRVMNHLGETFRNELILKGGMLLRLLNSPRLTQDIDFVLVSSESKVRLKQKLIRVLDRLPGTRIGAVEVNSRGIFIELTNDQETQRALVEINVEQETHLAPEPMSTAGLAQKYSLGARVVSTMALPEAFSHKIAATLERDTIRDVYDLSQFEAIGPFDPATLRERFSRLSIQRSKPKSVTFRKAAELLRKRIHLLDQTKVEIELFPILPAEYRQGVLKIMKASGGRIAQRLEATET